MSALTGSACAQSVTPGVTEALEIVRGHVERLETSVPNFICDEQIVSRLYLNQKVKKETRAQAVLTTTRTVEGGTFTESRAEMRINGKPTKRTDISGPFVWKGGPAYADLHYLFNSPHASECRSYQLTGGVKLESKDTLFLQAHANPGQGEMCRDLPETSVDKVWLEPASLNVLRIESVNPPTTRDSDPLDGGTLTLMVEYAPVVFDNAEYWLPSHFISRIDYVGSPRHYVYESFFSNYHKYGAESVIHIDPNQ